MAKVWRRALQRAAEFDAQASDYNQYRPRYPKACFDDLIETAGLTPGDEVVEVGAGTGIATVPLVAPSLPLRRGWIQVGPKWHEVDSCGEHPGQLGSRGQYRAATGVRAGPGSDN